MLLGNTFSNKLPDCFTETGSRNFFAICGENRAPIICANLVENRDLILYGISAEIFSEGHKGDKS